MEEKDGRVSRGVGERDVCGEERGRSVTTTIRFVCKYKTIRLRSPSAPQPLFIPLRGGLCVRVVQ